MDSRLRFRHVSPELITPSKMLTSFFSAVGVISTHIQFAYIRNTSAAIRNISNIILDKEEQVDKMNVCNCFDTGRVGKVGAKIYTYSIYIIRTR